MDASAPQSPKAYVYAKDVGGKKKLFYRDEAGTEIDVGLFMDALEEERRERMSRKK